MRVGMNSDTQGVTDGGTIPGEIAVGLHATAGSTQVPSPAVMNNADSAAPASVKSCAE